MFHDFLYLIFIPCRMFICPNSYHEVLLEAPPTRNAILRTIVDYFSQDNDDVQQVAGLYPLVPHDPNIPLFTVSELIFRSIGIGISTVGLLVGLSMMLGTRRSLDRVYGWFM
jgi:hypothetical protein